MKRASFFASALVFIAALSLPAQRIYADIAMTAQEVGGDVVFSYSGSIDLTNLAPGAPGTVRGTVYPVNSWVGFGPEEFTSTVTSYAGSVSSSPAPNIGPGAFQKASSSSGSHFSINLSAVSVPVGYVTNNPISGSITFSGKSLATMGVNSSGGPYTWVLTNGEKITLSFLPSNNGALKKTLQKKVKNLKKQIKRAKQSKQVSRLKKFKKKLKVLNAKLRAL